MFQLANDLSERAGLPFRPSLFVMRSDASNAFTVGGSKDPAIVLTDSLIATLSLREIRGVLAHEISHIRNGDLGMLSLADSFRRFTRTISIFGILFLLFNMNWLLMGQLSLPGGFLLLIISAPTLSLLLELALSRTREFEADRSTVALTDDPEGFIAALRKLDSRNYRFWSMIFGHRREPQTSNLFRTHPTTDERIARLQAAFGGKGPTEHSLSEHRSLLDW
jgi:heat shock protein HtpX